MNVPEAKKTREGIGGGLCADPEAPAVFFHSCIKAILGNGKDGRANQMQALPSPDGQRGVPIAYEVGA